jgi:anti-sigma B factor antagonist
MLPVPQVCGRWRRLSASGRLSSSIQEFHRAQGVLCVPRLALPIPHGVAPRRRRVISSHATHFSGAFFMHIEERNVGDVVVLDMKGKITLGEGDELLKDKVNSLVNQGHKKIILNLADVPYIDSAGLGEVVRTYTTVSRQGGSLKLLNLTKRITDLLSITKLLTVFETFDSENDAVRSFSASAKV